MMRKFIEIRENELKDFIDEIFDDKSEEKRGKIFSALRQPYVNMAANLFFHLNNKSIHVEPIAEKEGIKSMLTFADLFKCIRCAEETKNDDDASCEISDGSRITVKTNCLRCGLPVERTIESDAEEIKITDEY